MRGGLAAGVIAAFAAWTCQPACQAAEQSLTPTQTRICHALHASTQLEAVDAPLVDLMQYFSDLHAFSIRLDKEALVAAGAKPDAPVTRTLEGVSLDAALRLVLRQLKLAHVIERDHLLITTETAARRRIAQGAIDPATRPPDAKAARAKIQKGLASRAKVELVDAPLPEAVAFFRDAFNLPLVIDDRSLAEAGVAKDVRCTAKVDGATVEEALKTLLRPAGLSHAIEDELVLVVATKKPAKPARKTGGIEPSP